MGWFSRWFGTKSPATPAAANAAESVPASSASAKSTASASAPTASVSTTLDPVTFSLPAYDAATAVTVTITSVTLGSTTFAPASTIATAAQASVALSVLADLLREQGHVVTAGDGMLEVEGFVLRPWLDGIDDANGLCRSYTQIAASHPQLGDEPIVEYQFGHGDDTGQALRRGFENWYMLDFVVLLDALRETPQHCKTMSWSAGEAKDPSTGAPLSPCSYRVLFGPIHHFLGDPSRLAEGEDPGFCPCCLFTQSMEAFRPLLSQGRLIPTRLFVSRQADGEIAADCRINGEDYAPVRDALARWAGEWTDRGLEWRKQYVIAQPL